MPAPIQNFEGIDNPCMCMPPDTEGDVGPNHYMQWVNVHYAIWTKTGTQVVPPTPGNTLFTGLPNCGTYNRGDPQVLYDQFAGRWLASQFAFSDVHTGPYFQCVAVSLTDDPTGQWYRYEFEVSATSLDDYAKFGVWPSQHAYLMTANQALAPNLTPAGVGVWAFERDRMLAGQTARMVYEDLNPIDPTLPSMLPADADGSTPPPSGAPAPLIGMNPTVQQLPGDRLQVWNAIVDWTVPSVTVTKVADLHTAPYNTRLCGYQLCVPQPGTTVRLGPLSDRIMHRAQYRNFGSRHAIFASHTV